MAIHKKMIVVYQCDHEEGQNGCTEQLDVVCNSNEISTEEMNKVAEETALLLGWQTTKEMKCPYCKIASNVGVSSLIDYEDLSSADQEKIDAQDKEPHYEAGSIFHVCGWSLKMVDSWTQMVQLIERDSNG